MLHIVRSLLLAASVSSVPGSPQSFPNGVAAGDMTQDSAVLWARAAIPGTILFEYATEAAFGTLTGSATVSVVDPLIPAKVSIDGLAPGTTYAYRALSGGALAGGRFQTPPVTTTPTRVRFGVTGDLAQNLAPYPSIRNVPQRDLDFFAILGDAIYADVASPRQEAKARKIEEFRIKYDEALSKRQGLNTVAEARAATGWYAMLDDHEVVNDFAGGASPTSDSRFIGEPGAYINETPYYKAGLDAFHEFLPLRRAWYPEGGDPREAGKAKLYRSWRWGSDAAFMMVDARSFRDAELARVLGRDIWGAASFLLASAWPGRTLLGNRQMAELRSDLLSAQADRVTWKVVFIPEPIQNFGIIMAADRYEGYSAERSDLLAFIRDRGITNTVFITADFHALVVNDLGYGVPRTAVPGAFEIVTGAVAVEPPLGPGIAEFAKRTGLMTAPEGKAYDELSRSAKDKVIKGLIDRQLGAQGLDPLGLAGSAIQATLREGDYVSLHTFGWTEFEINGPDLSVTTWGIDWYSPEDVMKDPAAIATRQPIVVSRFDVRAMR